MKDSQKINATGNKNIVNNTINNYYHDIDIAKIQAIVSNTTKIELDKYCIEIAKKLNIEEILNDRIRRSFFVKGARLFTEIDETMQELFIAILNQALKEDNTGEAQANKILIEKLSMLSRNQLKILRFIYFLRARYKDNAFKNASEVINYLELMVSDNVFSFEFNADDISLLLMLDLISYQSKRYGFNGIWGIIIMLRHNLFLYIDNKARESTTLHDDDVMERNIDACEAWDKILSSEIILKILKKAEGLNNSELMLTTAGSYLIKKTIEIDNNF